MRALLSHSLHRLIRLLALIALCVCVSGSAAQLPQPIGQLSDYGAVLDRHGRERILELIEDAHARLGVEVFILASWENPFPDTKTFAVAIFDAWGLGARDSAILAVFVKTNGVWDHAVRGSSTRPDRSPAPKIEAEIAQLVSHRRIEEAMLALFAGLSRFLDPVADPTESSGSRRLPIGWIVLIVLLTATALIWAIHRRVCPSCGRILRKEPTARDASRQQRDRVYYCRACGFRRR